MTSFMVSPDFNVMSSLKNQLRVRKVINCAGVVPLTPDAPDGVFTSHSRLALPDACFTLANQRNFRQEELGSTFCTSATDRVVVVVGWLLNVPATCECISGTDLHRQFYVLPH